MKDEKDVVSPPCEIPDTIMMSGLGLPKSTNPPTASSSNARWVVTNSNHNDLCGAARSMIGDDSVLEQQQQEQQWHRRQSSSLNADTMRGLLGDFGVSLFIPLELSHLAGEAAPHTLQGPGQQQQQQQQQQQPIYVVVPVVEEGSTNMITTKRWTTTTSIDPDSAASPSRLIPQAMTPIHINRKTYSLPEDAPLVLPLPSLEASSDHHGIFKLGMKYPSTSAQSSLASSPMQTSINHKHHPHHHSTTASQTSDVSMIHHHHFVSASLGEPSVMTLATEELESDQSLMMEDHGGSCSCSCHAMTNAAAVTTTLTSQQTVQNAYVDAFLEPEPQDDLETCPRILSVAQIQQLHHDAIPESLQMNRWERCFAIGRDGDSFLSLLESCAHYVYTILVIRTVQGHILGGFASQTWQVQDGFQKKHSYYGNGQSFLFCNHPAFEPDSDQASSSPSSSSSSAPSDHESLSIYRWTGCNDYCQLCDADKSGGLLGMGGAGDFGWIVQDDFGHGVTGRCATFGNPPLVPTPGGTFDVADFEVYGVVPLFHSYFSTSNIHMSSSITNNNNLLSQFNTTNLSTRSTSSGLGSPALSHHHHHPDRIRRDNSTSSTTTTTPIPSWLISSSSTTTITGSQRSTMTLSSRWK